MSLTNIYSPSVIILPSPSLPPPPSSSSTTTSSSTSSSHKSLRPLHISLSPLPNSTGSCLLESGQTKVLVSIRGPHRQTNAATQQDTSDTAGSYIEKGGLNVTVKYAPFARRRNNTSSGGGGGNSTKMTEDERELSGRIISVLKPTINLTTIPKLLLSLYITVLSDDGCLLPVCIVASSLALASSGIELYDLVSACTVAVTKKSRHGTSIIVDPTHEEISSSSMQMTLSLLPNLDTIVLWDQTGQPASVDEMEEAAELCRDGINSVHELMKTALLEEIGGE